MRALFVTSEAFPLAKTGGLADVSAALPLALAAEGVDIRLVMPAYPGALAAAVDRRPPLEIGEMLGAGPARLVPACLPGSKLPVWLVDCPALFDRPGDLYVDEQGVEWSDNARRFGALCHAAARIALGAAAPDWRADVVHANDWHAGLVAPLLRAAGAGRSATLFTIHNLAFQGLFPAETVAELGLDWADFTPDGLEFHRSLSFLKAGLRYSDALTTVSPSYAAAIVTEADGCGLAGLLRQRAGDLVGILNGIDEARWNPATDPWLPAAFRLDDTAGKRLCKAELQRELGLPVDPEVPLLAFICRLTGQKMADTLVEALPALAARGTQVAVHGRGDPAIEEGLRAAARRHAGSIAVRVGYEERLAHRIVGGSDILLHPSRFEPCGLTQLYALRYGTLPVVRRVGGLADTVVDAAPAAMQRGEATGFAFDAATADAMLACIDRALALYRQPLAWRRLQRQAMRQDFGWTRSARRYLSLYRKLAPAAARVAPAGPDRARTGRRPPPAARVAAGD